MIVGIDISSKILAIACLDRDAFSMLELRSNKKTWIERWYDLHDKFTLYVEENLCSNNVVYIEDIPYVQNTKTLVILVYFIAMCCLVLHKYNIKHQVVNNNTWKKEVGVPTFRRKRNEVKEDIRNRCIELFKVEKTMSQDSMDALLIAYYGQLVEGRRGKNDGTPVFK